MPEINQFAPTFQLPTLDGSWVSWTDFRGKIIVLNFWSAECTWSERTDTLLTAWQSAWGEHVIVLRIASNANEDLPLLQRTAAARGLKRVLVDAERLAAGLYAAQTTPHLYLIDESGLLRYQGSIDDVTFRRREPTRFYLHEAVAALLAGQPPATPETPPYGCTIVSFHQGLSEK